MIDWTDAFDNSGYVAGSEAIRARWAEHAQRYRDDLSGRGLAELGVRYGDGDRNAFDLFHPDGTPRGLVVFIHGGYWQMMDRSVFSHLAEGSRARGWAVAMPSYTLAPAARISQITREVAGAVSAAARRIEGPVRIAGHSAGGHLAARLACADGVLPEAVAKRLERILSISGIHDLRPITLSAMNEVLRLTEAEAEAESPALHDPRPGLAVRFHVGAAERPELLRQTRLIAEAWGRKGADVADAYLPGEDHFSIVDGLTRQRSALLAALLD